MDSHRAERFAEGLATPEEMSPEERAIEVLVKKSVRAPARLEPADLVPLVGLLGTSGALEVVAMLGAFHFVTRVADLVAIESELPIVQRRWRWLRSLGVRLQSRVFRRVMDLANEAVEVDVRMLLAETERIRGASLPSGYAAMHASPNVAAWAYRMTVELPSLDAAMLGRVTRGVAAALPASEDESTGFHARPPEPLDALAITSQRKLDARTPGAATPAAKRSLIVDFRVEDVDRERARLGPIVRRFVLEPTDQPWGNRAMLFRDPDGNLVNVFHPIRR